MNLVLLTMLRLTLFSESEDFYVFKSSLLYFSLFILPETLIRCTLDFLILSSLSTDLFDIFFSLSLVLYIFLALPPCSLNISLGILIC